MKTKLGIWLLISCLAAIVVSESETDSNDDQEDQENKDLSNGFGGNVDWVSYEDAFRLNKDPNDNRPILVIAYSPGCGACRNLKPVLRKSAEFADISKKFLMVSINSRSLPEESDVSPGGMGYVPRIFFFDKKGQVRYEIKNEFGEKEYEYYYPDAESLIASMKRALEMFAEPKQETTTRNEF